MKILYICTQRPGFGGASTETYEAIKRLRDLGHTVVGLFIVGRNNERSLCDPDGIGGIESALWRHRDDHSLLAGDYDVLIGKNYEAGWVIRKRSDIPVVYLTSGIDYVSRLNKPAKELHEPFPKGGVDLRVFENASYVLVHSTLDLSIYRQFLPANLLNKIVDGVIYTPNIAVPSIDPGLLPKHDDRPFDLCFSASNWTRGMKNPTLLREMCSRLANDFKIVVCGEQFDHPGVHCPGLVIHRQMIKKLKMSRVTAIPSLYDPSPNLYPEAVYAGCNVVVSPNVGNIDGHPHQFLSKDLSPDSFERTLRVALTTKKQLGYRTPTPEEGAKQLESAVQKIITHFKRVLDRRSPKPSPPSTTYMADSITADSITADSTDLSPEV